LPPYVPVCRLVGLGSPLFSYWAPQGEKKGKRREGKGEGGDVSPCIDTSCVGARKAKFVDLLVQLSTLTLSRSLRGGKEGGREETFFWPWLGPFSQSSADWPGRPGHSTSSFQGGKEREIGTRNGAGFGKRNSGPSCPKHTNEGSGTRGVSTSASSPLRKEKGWEGGEGPEVPAAGACVTHPAAPRSFLPQTTEEQKKGRTNPAEGPSPARCSAFPPAPQFRSRWPLPPARKGEKVEGGRPTTRMTQLSTGRHLPCGSCILPAS